MGFLRGGCYFFVKIFLCVFLIVVIEFWRGFLSLGVYWCYFGGFFLFV